MAATSTPPDMVLTPQEVIDNFWKTNLGNQSTIAKRKVSVLNHILLRSFTLK
jgi:hypothetical protein